MKKRTIAVVSTIMGVIPFVLVLYLFNVGEVFTHMMGIGYIGVAAFLANVAIIMLVGGLSWQIILRAYGHDLPFRDVLVIKMIGFAISYLTPSMYVGGEPVRIYLMGKKHNIAMTRVGATVVVDKFLELSAGLFFIILGSIYTLVSYELPLQLFVVVVVLNILFLLGAVLFFVVFVFRLKPLSSILALLARIRLFRRSVMKVTPFLQRLEGDISVAFGQHKKATLQSFALNLLVGGFIFIKPAIFFYFLNTIFNLSQLSLLYALTHLILAFQFTPGALGIFEWGEVGIFSIVGVGSAKALAYALMVRIADLIVVALAAVVGVHMGWKYIWSSRRQCESA